MMASKLPEEFDRLFRPEPTQPAQVTDDKAATAQVRTVDQNFVATQEFPPATRTQELPKVDAPVRPRQRSRRFSRLKPWQTLLLSFIGLPLLGYVSYLIASQCIPALPAPPTPPIPGIFKEEEKKEEPKEETPVYFPGFEEPSTTREQPRETTRPKTSPTGDVTPTPSASGTPSPEASSSPTDIPPPSSSSSPIIVIPSILPTESPEPTQPSEPTPQPSPSTADPTEPSVEEAPVEESPVKPAP